MSAWEIVYSESAENDLRGIYEYIAFSLLETGIATNQTRRIMDAVRQLSQMPLRHHIYEKERWRGRGLRVMPVDNFLVFYLPMESKNTVVVIRIMYGGRNIEEQLRQTEAEE